MTHKIVEIQGVSLKLVKIPAIAARQLLNSMGDNLSVLRPYIAVKSDSNEWHTLDSVTAVNSWLNSWEVLSLAEAEAYEYNYSFLASWKPFAVPSQMATTKYVVAESKHVDPMVAALVTAGFASYLELRDTLSLEEAFKLMDVLTVKKINEFRAAESNKA